MMQTLGWHYDVDTLSYKNSTPNYREAHFMSRACTQIFRVVLCLTIKNKKTMWMSQNKTEINNGLFM